jgi:tRNA G18 (ribose-2'-O)-methylase SpoU
MSDKTFEIRVCESCGLRYPLLKGHTYGTRCPICTGTTRVVLSRELATEPQTDSHPEETKPVKKSLKDARQDKESSRSLRLRGSKTFSVLLDNIRSAWNVGSILRSADGFGFTHAYLCGITPTPENDAVQKTSLGAEDSVSWSYHKDAVKLVEGLKVEGWKVIALEEDARASAIPRLTDSQFPNPVVLIVGNEVTGIDPELLDLCDEIYYIPMRGEKKSFNVAVAFAIAAFTLQS